MKISSDLQFSEKPKVVKCPQCSSTNIESSSRIDIPEWEPGSTTKKETSVLTSYVCLMCGQRFTSKDIENRKTFNQGMMTLFFISIMIVLLLIVLL